MKHSFFVIFTILFAQCVGNKKNSDSAIPCKDSKFYGEIEVCMPKIIGMQECMSHPKLKQRHGIHVIADNTTLGIYLKDSFINELNGSTFPDSINLESYFKVYGLGKLKGVKIGQTEFNQIIEPYKNKVNRLDSMFLDVQISMLKSEKTMNNLRVITGESKNETQASTFFSEPLWISFYKLNEQISTAVLVSLSPFDKYEVVIGTLSMVKILDTVIFYGYYENYKSSNSIVNVKDQNNKFGLELLRLNTK